MTNIFSRSYPTYPIYEPFLECGVGKIYNLDLNNLPYCEYITTPDNCNNENTFCINNNQFFWCPEGKYLDIIIHYLVMMIVLLVIQDQEM